MSTETVPTPEELAEFLIGKDGTAEIYGCEVILPKLPDPEQPAAGRVPLCFWRPKREITDVERRLVCQLVAMIIKNRAEEMKPLV
jgi:hypothetical protein